MFRAELYRAFRGHSFLVALLLGAAALGFGLYNYGGPIQPPPPGVISRYPPFFYNAYDAVVWSQNTIIALLVPIIAVLPFADSLTLDRTSGYLRSILTRTSYRRYLWAKITAGVLAGGCAVALPLLGLFAITYLFYPHGLNLVPETQRMPLQPNALGPFGALYQSTPALYIFALAATCFVGGGVYALLGLAIATFTDKRYLVLATPLMLYHMATFVIANLGLSQWLLYSAFAPQIVIDVTWVNVFPTLGLIALISTFILLTSAPRTRARA